MCYVKYLFAPQKVVKRLGFKYVGMCCKKSGGLLLCNDRSGAETTGSFSAHTATHSISGNAHETQNFSTELRKTKKCQRTLDTNDFKDKFDFPPASLYNIQYTTRKGYPL